MSGRYEQLLRLQRKNPANERGSAVNCLHKRGTNSVAVSKILERLCLKSSIRYRKAYGLLSRGVTPRFSRSSGRARGQGVRASRSWGASGGVYRGTWGHAGASVLDIGGGIGALALSLLARGSAEAQLVEVSPAYLSAARALAVKRGVADRLRLFEGDFVTLGGVAPADIVTLDRVVCCYPDPEALLGRAAHASRRWLMFSYPAPSWPVRVFRAAINGVMKLVGWSYRFYLHDEARLLRAAKRAGHRLVERQNLGVWRLVVLER